MYSGKKKKKTGVCIDLRMFYLDLTLKGTNRHRPFLLVVLAFHLCLSFIALLPLQVRDNDNRVATTTATPMAAAVVVNDLFNEFFQCIN